MISELLIIAAAVVFSLGLRSYRHPVLHRLGTFGLLFGVSFLVGWLLLDSVVTGVLLAGTWLLLPWMEILTRARRLRLPMERPLNRRHAPTREDFPNLRDLTEEIETAGFECVDDVGWQYDEHDQFFRLFYQAASGTEAAVSLVTQGEVAFFYIAITSRAANEETYVTWNYPFAYGLKLDPSLHLNRGPGDASFSELLAEHRLFLDRERVAVDAILPQEPERLGALMESDMRRQIAHNLHAGVLKRDGTDFIRYSARGLLFLWCQFLRDLVRLS